MLIVIIGNILVMIVSIIIYYLFRGFLKNYYKVIFLFVYKCFNFINYDKDVYWLIRWGNEYIYNLDYVNCVLC